MRKRKENNKIPDAIFYVYFTRKDLININPCRFTNYNDAFSFALRYDKDLIYTKIIPFIPNYGKIYRREQLLFDKVLRKIFLYGKAYNNRLLNTTTYEEKSPVKEKMADIDLSAKKHLHTELLLYKNVMITVDFYISIHGCSFVPTDNELLRPCDHDHNSYANFKSILITENNRYLCLNIKDRYWRDVIADEKLIYLYDSLGRIEIHFYDSNDENDPIMLCTNDNCYVYNYYRKLDELLKRASRYQLGDNTRVSLEDVIKGTYDLPKYSIKNNNATDFLSDFLSNKNV